MLSGLDGRPGVQLAPNRSAEGYDPLTLCRELNKESDATEKALRDDLDRLSVVRQELLVSLVWVAW